MLLALSFLLFLSINAERLNLALRKNASQVSVEKDLLSICNPNHAVDGSRESELLKGSCSCTAAANPGGPRRLWWAVDLKVTVFIGRVEVYPEDDGLKSAQVWVSEVSRFDSAANEKQQKECLQQKSDVTVQVFRCFGARGRFVTVVTEDSESALKLCEVEVYESKIHS